MSTLLEELAARLRGEVPELGRAVERAVNAWLKGRTLSEDREVHVDSAALRPERMERLMSGLCTTWAGVRGELLAFADFLAELTTPTGGERRE